MILELLGFVGGGFFFASWVLQWWQTKKAGKAIVGKGFFLLRILGTLLLMVEAVRVKSAVYILLNIATIAMMSYGFSKATSTK